MTTKPTKPTPPSPLPSRTGAPSNFSAAADAGVEFQWTTLPTYIDDSLDFMEEKNEETLAAAVAGNLSEVDLAALAGQVLAVNEEGLALEGAEIVEIEVATQGEAEAGTATGVYMDPLRTKQAAAVQVPALMNASGSAPMFAARAWVNFNGSGTVSIRASGNVSSITDNGTGDYTVNLITPMEDANYAVVVGGGAGDLNIDRHAIPKYGSVTVSSFGILTGSSGSNTRGDQVYVYAAIFR